MGWPPEVIARTGLPEFTAAFRGWIRAQGGDDRPAPLTRDELNDLKRWEAAGKPKGYEEWRRKTSPG